MEFLKTMLDYVSGMGKWDQEKMRLNDLVKKKT